MPHMPEVGVIACGVQVRGLAAHLTALPCSQLDVKVPIKTTAPMFGQPMYQRKRIHGGLATFVVVLVAMLVVVFDVSAVQCSAACDSIASANGVCRSCRKPSLPAIVVYACFRVGNANVPS